MSTSGQGCPCSAGASSCSHRHRADAGHAFVCPNAFADLTAVEAVYRSAAESAKRETFHLSYWPVLDDPTVERADESATRVRQDIDT
ncbi:hypothetical protein [Haloarcula sp. CBA1127]|uniref:hypothetical protein n=1 Tax=Haloarcula sp. CBA1127 TaxID=1765055 RepID=UPI000A76FBD4|nr:hypothetical protein [Haloarcula sp. CBA1127]